MFDIGFLELFVIGIIALIVLGPERLPKAARALGLWIGKAKHGFNAIKTEIDRELKVQELQQQIQQQKEQFEQQVQLDSIKDTVEKTEKALDDLSQDLKTESSQSSIKPDKLAK